MNNNVLDWPKLEAFADNKLKDASMKTTFADNKLKEAKMILIDKNRKHCWKRRK